MDSRSGDADEIVVDLITKSQSQLYAYIISLLFRRQDSLDVLQETNVVMWQKRGEAPKSDEFIAWACRVAYFQVLAYRKKQQRDRLFFAESLLADLATPAQRLSTRQQSRIEALAKCMSGLSEKNLQLLRFRYRSALSLEEISKEVNKSVAALTQALYRVRRGLLGCVQRTEAAEA